MTKLTFAQLRNSGNIFQELFNAGEYASVVKLNYPTWVCFLLEGAVADKDTPDTVSRETQEELTMLLDILEKSTVYHAWIDEGVHAEVRLHESLWPINKLLLGLGCEVEYRYNKIVYNNVPKEWVDEMYVQLDWLAEHFDWQWSHLDGKLTFC